ncbi:UbiA family prenyltransferase [Nocardia sp. XZ_19_385]|uniref:UbiA family prenyltransferase n=1 Tax=Nocardia sp. XZ_19_385 TaxID=2769488 RepID=UPI00188F10CB|nr:UbiA family prenyltransferase [Nocardia sp. XZ_19_385]
MTGTSTAPALFASLARLAHFTKVMYKPHYLLYAIIWVLALEGTAAVVAQPGTPWRPTGATVVRIAVVAITLLYLRMLDEQKDLEYDRLHNPDRPLVTGAVSASELRFAMAVLAAVAIGLSLTLSLRSALLIAAVLAYGLALWAMERLSESLRTGILLNLAVTYPIQLLVIAYVLGSGIDTGEVRADWRIAATALVSTGVFLSFEVARKTTRANRPGELLYSRTLGPIGSAITALLLAATAVAAYLTLIRPVLTAPVVLEWIPLALLVIPAAATWQFVRSDRTEHPVLPAVGFTLALYLSLIVLALV